MSKKTLFFSLVISLLITACYNEDSFEQLPLKAKKVEFTDVELATLYQMRGDSHKVDIDEATRFANDVIDLLDGNVNTRTTPLRRIDSVIALTSRDMQKTITRAASGITIGIPDTVAYVFNFGDNAGYAIVSGDKRIDAPILGYCAAGSLTEAIDNPGLIGLLADTEDYIVASIARYENRIESITKGIINKMLEDSAATRATFLPGDPYDLIIRDVGDDVYLPTTTTTSTTLGNRVTTSQIQPLLPVEWNQRFPFNYLVKNNNGCTNAPAGCVAVSLAQIMAYWQHPVSTYNYTFNWPLLRSYTAKSDAYPNVANKKEYHNDESYYKALLSDEKITSDEQNFVSQVSNLLSIIGLGVHMNYTDNGSGATNENATNFLSSYGYNTSPMIDYNYNKVIQSLNNRRPVYASGYSEKIQHRIKLFGWTIGTWSEYNKGHAWVIDGYLNRQRTTAVEVTVIEHSTGKILSQTTTTTYSTVQYLHHNWGWERENDNHYNCYIVAGSYDVYDEDGLPSNTRATVTYDEKNYQFLKDICVDIHPR